MRNLTFLFIILSYFGVAQKTKNLKIEFKPKQHSLMSKEKYDSEINGLYKYWKYYAEIEYSNLDTNTESYSIQFIQDNFESEKHYSFLEKKEIKYMPSSNNFIAIGKVYNKSTNTIIQHDTLNYKTLDHEKLNDCKCENLMVKRKVVTDGVQWRLCANKLQFSKVGNKIPDFLFKDINGKPYNLLDFKNKVIFINAWFIGCAPCVGELPLLKALANKFKDNEDVVFLTYVRTRKEKVLAKKKIYGDSYDNFIMIPNDEFKLEDYFGMTGYPTNYILDKNQIFRFMTNGYPLLKDMKYGDYKKGFINNEVLDNYVEIINKLIKE